MSEKLEEKFKNQLCKWLDRTCEFWLLYQASRDGVNSNTFHQKCNNKGPTVTLFYNTNRSVFGGYTSVNWASNGDYSYDDNAFIFKLQYNGTMQPKKFPVKTLEYAIYNSGSYGPMFGGSSSCDIYSFSGSLSWSGSGSDRYVQLNGSCAFGNSYIVYGENTNTITNGHYQVHDIEVYAVKEVKNGGKYQQIYISPFLDRSWRVGPEWNDETLTDLRSFMEQYTPYEESKVPAANILLVGQVGAGKSSFFNSVNSALRGSISCKAASGTAETSLTTMFRKYICKSKAGKNLNIKLCDTRGLEVNQGLHPDDVDALLEGHISEGYTFKPSVAISPEFVTYIASPTAKDKIHCLAFVIDSSTVEALSDALIRRYKSISKTALSKGIPMVVLLTKIDKVCEEVDKDITKVFISKAVFKAVTTIAEIIGLPRGHVLPLKNYENETMPSTNVDILLLQALRQILTFADDSFENQHEMSLVAKLDKTKLND